MKVKNKSTRNVNLLGKHTRSVVGITCVLSPAGSTLELDDVKWAEVSKSAQQYIDAGLMEILESPESSLTKEEIAKKVLDKISVKIDVTKMTKKAVQKMAESLGVEV